MAKRFWAILFMILFVFSVSAVTVLASAEELTGSDDTEDITEETATAADNTDTVGDTEDVGITEGDNAANITGETPTEQQTEPTDENKAESKSVWYYVIIVAIVIVVLGVAFIIVWRNKKWRERIKKFIRDYKSEMKKIVWPTRAQVIQNTGVVLVAIIFIALMVGILDLAFGYGINSLGGIKSLFTSAPTA